jgi:hypothetical protein
VKGCEDYDVVLRVQLLGTTATAACCHEWLPLLACDHEQDRAPHKQQQRCRAHRDANYVLAQWDVTYKSKGRAFERDERVECTKTWVLLRICHLVYFVGALLIVLGNPLCCVYGVCGAICHWRAGT